MSEALPAGWHSEPSDQGTYYWHETSGAVQWERPTASAVPDAPAPPSAAPAAEPSSSASSASSSTATWSGVKQSSSTRDAILVLQQAAAAGAGFVACAYELGVEVAGYAFAKGGADGTGYYRQPNAPPPDDAAYSRVVLQRASAAGASFVAIDVPLEGFTLPGYEYAHGAEGPGYYRRPPSQQQQPTVAGAPAIASASAATSLAGPASSAAASSAAASSAAASSAAVSTVATRPPPSAAEVAAWCVAGARTRRLLALSPVLVLFRAALSAQPVHARPLCVLTRGRCAC